MKLARQKYCLVSKEYKVGSNEPMPVAIRYAAAAFLIVILLSLAAIVGTLGVAICHNIWSALS